MLFTTEIKLNSDQLKELICQSLRKSGIQAYPQNIEFSMRQVEKVDYKKDSWVELELTGATVKDIKIGIEELK